MPFFLMTHLKHSWALQWHWAGTTPVMEALLLRAAPDDGPSHSSRRSPQHAPRLPRHLCAAPYLGTSNQEPCPRQQVKGCARQVWLSGGTSSIQGKGQALCCHPLCSFTGCVHGLASLVSLRVPWSTPTLPTAGQSKSQEHVSQQDPLPQNPEPQISSRYLCQVQSSESCLLKTTLFNTHFVYEVKVTDVGASGESQLSVLITPCPT